METDHLILPTHACFALTCRADTGCKCCLGFRVDIRVVPQVNVHEHDQGTSAAAQPGVDGMTIRLSHDTCNAVNASYGASSFPGTQWEGFCTPSFTLSAFKHS